MKLLKEEHITILKKMLRRMKEGTLGCSGFNIIETDVFCCAINELEKSISTRSSEKSKQSSKTKSKGDKPSTYITDRVFE